MNKRKKKQKSINIKQYKTVVFDHWLIAEAASSDDFLSLQWFVSYIMLVILLFFS
jgi:hypothetical protein